MGKIDVSGGTRIKRVFLCGASMGGSASLTFAALHPELIDGVAARNGTANHLEFENFQDAIRHSFVGSRPENPGEYKRRRAEYCPEKLTMPIGITAGGQDPVVPPACVVRLTGVLTTLQRDVHMIYRVDGCHPWQGHWTQPARCSICSLSSGAKRKSKTSRSSRM